MPLNELFESLIYLCTTKPTDFSMGFVRTSQEEDRKPLFISTIADFADNLPIYI